MQYRTHSVIMAVLVCLVATGAARASGILAPADQTLPPLRVTSHLVDATVHDGVAITEVTQTFRNDTNRRLEATYVFPLPEDGDLTDFRMSFNGRMVEGQVLPKDEARAIYESIVRQSRDPGLIEFIGRRLLQMRVFPIEPHSDTTVKVRYQQICPPVSGMTAYRYPLRTGRTADGRAYGTVRFTVKLHDSAPLKGIWSPSHAVDVSRRGEHDAEIAFEANGASLEDDFLLLYGTDSSDLGLSVVAHRDDDEDGHFVLMLTPRQLWPEQSRQPQDVVFVVDTSGSMAGEKLTQARSALKFCVDQLDARDRFSVVRFSTGYDTLFASLVPASADNREQARGWIDRFQAAGGTNITDALVEALALQNDETRPFVVVFLTDGLGNRPPDRILDHIEGQVGKSVRIFPFGVGHDVNTMLLDRLAGAAMGKPTYVQPGEDLEVMLGDFFSVVSQPVLTRLTISLPDIGATDRFPAQIGDLYHGQQIILAGRYDRVACGPVTLTAMRDGEKVTYTWNDVSFGSTPGATYVPSVWAGRKIAYLLDQIRAHGENQEMIDEVLALSQEFGIQTPYSSWFVNPEQRDRVMLGRAVPVRVLEGLPAATVAPGPATPMMLNGAVSADEALAGMTRQAGKAATAVSAYTASLRERSSAGAGRIDDRLLPRVRIGGRWYERVRGYLIDARIDEDTVITRVRFGSEAYFELVGNRSDLLGVLASDRHVCVLIANDHAVLVADSEGIEALDDELRAKLRSYAP